MKRITAFIFITAIITVLCGITALAEPPNPFEPMDSYPDETTTAAQTAATVTTTTETTTTSQQTTTEAPTTTAPPPTLIPDNSREIEQDGTRKIIKTYKLSAKQNPAHISRESIELNGWIYTFGDIKSRETTETLTQTYTMHVPILPDTTDVSAIIQVLDKSFIYTSADDYSGVLTLDESSVTAEVTGTKIVPFELRETRTFENLSSNDSSVIPKTLQDKYGRVLTLSSLEWRTNTAFYVEESTFPDSFTAFATYTGTGYKNVVTGYAGSADYTGVISKIIPGKTVYTVTFIGEPIPPPTTTEAPTTETTTEQTTTEETTTEPIPEEEPEEFNAVPIVVTASSVGGAGILAGLAFFFFPVIKNVKICGFSLANNRFEEIGRARVSYRSPAIDLTPFSGKCDNAQYLIILGKIAAFRLKNKNVTVNCVGSSLTHTVNSGGFEAYQFEVRF